MGESNGLRVGNWNNFKEIDDRVYTRHGPELIINIQNRNAPWSDHIDGNFFQWIHIYDIFGGTCPYFLLCRLYLWQYSQELVKVEVVFVILSNQKCGAKVWYNFVWPAWPSKLWSHEKDIFWRESGITMETRFDRIG